MLCIIPGRVNHFFLASTVIVTFSVVCFSFCAYINLSWCNYEIYDVQIYYLTTKT